jgi:hypothetical protein
MSILLLGDPFDIHKSDMVASAIRGDAGFYFGWMGSTRKSRHVSLARHRGRHVEIFLIGFASIPRVPLAEAAGGSRPKAPSPAPCPSP